MPGNRRRFALSAPYVELIHDSYVTAWWPNTPEPVGPGEYRDHGLVQAAVARPFQTTFGHELFPTLQEKGAALFHSLIATHPFDNGNKRTAVIALDLFLTANGQFLYLDNDRMYRLAVDTASYVPRGIAHDEMLARIASEIRQSTMPIARMADAGFDRNLVRAVGSIRRSVRKHPYNEAVQEAYFSG